MTDADDQGNTLDPNVCPRCGRAWSDHPDMPPAAVQTFRDIWSGAYQPEPPPSLRPWHWGTLIDLARERARRRPGPPEHSPSGA